MENRTGHRVYRVAILMALMFFALPLTRSPAGGSADVLAMTLAERVASLEEFRQQQRDWNHGTENRLSSEMTASQGAQDARMAAMEKELSGVSAQQMVIYAFGGLGSLLFVVGAPIVWSAYSRQHRKIARYQRRLERIYRGSGFEMLPDEEDGDG